MTQLYVTRGSLPARLLHYAWLHAEDVAIGIVLVIAVVGLGWEMMR